MTLSVLGCMQLTLQSVLPTSLQMEMEKRPKLARTRLMAVPGSQLISRVEPSHPYLVRRSRERPGKEGEAEMTVELLFS